MVVELLVVAAVRVILPEVYALLYLAAGREDAGLLVRAGRHRLDGREALGLLADALGVQPPACVALDAEPLYFPVVQRPEGEGLRYLRLVLGVYHVHHIDVVSEKVSHNHAVVVLAGVCDVCNGYHAVRRPSPYVFHLEVVEGLCREQEAFCGPRVLLVEAHEDVGVALLCRQQPGEAVALRPEGFAFVPGVYVGGVALLDGLEFDDFPFSRLALEDDAGEVVLVPARKGDELAAVVVQAGGGDGVVPVLDAPPNRGAPCVLRVFVRVVDDEHVEGAAR